MLKPLNNNVVIEPLEVEKKTASGILLTGDGANPNYAEGIVLAVGPGYLKVDGSGREVMSVQVGDRVIYQAYEGQIRVPYEGKDVLIFDEGIILAIVEEAK